MLKFAPGPGVWVTGHDNGTSWGDYFNILDHKLAIDTIETIDTTDGWTNDGENNNELTPVNLKGNTI